MAIGVIVIVAVVLIPSRAIESDSRDASRSADMALLASQTEAQTSDVLSMVFTNMSALFARPEFSALSPAQQGMLRGELLRLDAAAPAPNIPNLRIEMSPEDALWMQHSLERLKQEAETLTSHFAGRENAIDMHTTAVANLDALETYLDAPQTSNFRFLVTYTFQIQDQAKVMVPLLQAEAQSHRDDLLSTTRQSRLVAFIAAGIVGAALLLMTLLLGRRINGALAAAEAEKAAMKVATKSLEYRNSQLGALYNVFTQITETLSLQYVVNTTNREALKLMRADVAIMRLLKDGKLVPVGGLQANGAPVENIETMELGKGLIGQTAHHGRTLRIGEFDADQMSESVRPNGMRSGLIVPLIVGARVVGVLDCWSRLPNEFSEEDQRIMEMMASQVATAVVSADTHEASVESANHDPLTGLSNRRQLANDMADVFPQRLAGGEPLSIAMIDIDHFSLFNNNFGHKTGDITLQKVAHVLRSAIRESDRVYRYGGEEFLVVFDCGLEEGLRLAERLRVAIADTPHTGENMQPIGPITVSVGVAAFPEHGDTVQTLTENADAALLRAKEQGRNRVVVWEPAAPSLNAAA